MRKIRLLICGVSAAAMLSLSSVAAQSVGDLLKQKIKAALPTVTANNGKQSPSAAPALSLPVTSKAHPDVLGIKVGVSTVDDVRSILNGAALALQVEEHRARMLGDSTTGRGFRTQIEIPNSEYLDLITGTSETYKPQHLYDSPCSQNNTNCQNLRVGFSAPPNKGTVLALSRLIHFADGPLTEVVIKGLIAKYGQPGFRDSYGDKGVELRLVWAWALDGSTLPLHAGHFCALQTTAGTGGVAALSSIERSKNALQAGCAAMLYVIINQENSVAQFETIYLIDHHCIYTAGTKTTTFVAEGVATYEACEREKAAKTSVSREFSDDPTSTKASPAVANSSSSCTSPDNMNKAAQQNPRTLDAAQTVNTRPAASNSASDVSAIATSTTDETQPDVLGIKLGMPAAEARLLVTGHHLKKYAETKTQIVYSASDFSPVKLPGEYISGMANYTGITDTVDETFVVAMTPIPGAENVDAIYRAVGARHVENQFSFDKLRASFITKYGKPSNEYVIYTQDTMLWRYHARSIPREKEDLFMTTTCHTTYSTSAPIDQTLSARSPVGNWPLVGQGTEANRAFFNEKSRDCGDAYLVVVLTTANPAAPQDQRLVSNYTVALHGLSIATGAIKQIDAAIAADKARHDKENLERAKRNTPSN